MYKTARIKTIKCSYKILSQAINTATIKNKQNIKFDLESVIFI